MACFICGDTEGCKCCGCGAGVYIVLEEFLTCKGLKNHKARQNPHVSHAHEPQPSRFRPDRQTPNPLTLIA